MRIGLYEMNIIWEDKEANLEHLRAMAFRAREKGAEMMLLPEMSFTGFSMHLERTAERNNETLASVREIAETCGIAIGFGWTYGLNEELTRAENRYTVIGSDGRILFDYAKIHPFTYGGEGEHFTGGTELKYFEAGGFTFSGVICYDMRFPELFSIASRKAQAIIVPANWPSTRAIHWETLSRARAIDNQIYLLAINCIGPRHRVSYAGGSRIISPSGRILEPVETLFEGEAPPDPETSGNISEASPAAGNVSQASPKPEAGSRPFPQPSSPEPFSDPIFGRKLDVGDSRGRLILYDIENDVREIREGFPVSRDRREDLYALLNAEARK